MIPKGPDSKAIIGINVTMLTAVLFAALAWWLWPETVEGWREGSMAILCGFSALAQTIVGIRKIHALIARDIPVGKFERENRKARSDEMADENALRKAGMIE